MDLVSIGVPVYNGEKYLRDSLDSIINQTYRNLEILIVDDQSTDGSISIAEEYRSKDNRIRVVRNEKNLGLVGNWNKCIEEFEGEYLKLHFQDDMMLHDTIEKMIRIAKEESVEVVLTDREYRFENEINPFYIEGLPRLSDHYKEPSVISPEFMIKMIKKYRIDVNFIGEPILALLHKEVFDKYGLYDDSLKQICDFEYLVRLGVNENIGFLPERLHIFRLHDESQGAKNAREIEINPSHIDRILMAGMMHENEHYSTLRNKVGNSFTKHLLEEFVTKYTKNYGKALLSKRVDERYFQFFKPKPKGWKKVLTKLKRDN